MSDLESIRDTQGRFKVGNPGGPGRPRRLVEHDYLRALTEAVPMETWQRIIATAVSKALEGDDKARAWLSRYLLGDGLPTLVRLAALEAEGIDPIESERDSVRLDSITIGFSAV